MLVRALIVMLLVLNAGVAAWWISQEPAPPAPAGAEVPGIARLQLVREAEETGIPGRVPPGTPQPAIAEAGSARCVALGPFPTRDAAETATAALRPRVTRVAVREQAGAEGATGWRVFLPAAADRDAALATAARIGAAGFDDYLVVREGDEANSIALGRYRSQSGAQRRAEALKSAGFDARVEPLGGAMTYWLDVEAPATFDPEQARASIAASQAKLRECAPGR